jgi:hypothetical protein
MTASMVRERAPERARPGRWAAHRSREALVFGGATAVALLHALDDAIFHRQPGVGLGQHALAAGLALVLGLGAVYVFPYARRRCARRSPWSSGPSVSTDDGSRSLPLAITEARSSSSVTTAGRPERERREAAWDGCFRRESGSGGRPG